MHEANFMHDLSQSGGRPTTSSGVAGARAPDQRALVQRGREFLRQLKIQASEADTAGCVRGLCVQALCWSSRGS